MLAACGHQILSRPQSSIWTNKPDILIVCHGWKLEHALPIQSKTTTDNQNNLTSNNHTEICFPALFFLWLEVDWKLKILQFLVSFLPLAKFRSKRKQLNKYRQRKNGSLPLFPQKGKEWWVTSAIIIKCASHSHTWHKPTNLEMKGHAEQRCLFFFLAIFNYRYYYNHLKILGTYKALV